MIRLWMDSEGILGSSPSTALYPYTLPVHATAAADNSRLAQDGAEESSTAYGIAVKQLLPSRGEARARVALLRVTTGVATMESVEDLSMPPEAPSRRDTPSMEVHDHSIISDDGAEASGVWEQDGTRELPRTLQPPPLRLSLNWSKGSATSGHSAVEKAQVDSECFVSGESLVPITAEGLWVPALPTADNAAPPSVAIDLLLSLQDGCILLWGSGELLGSCKFHNGRTASPIGLLPRLGSTCIVVFDDGKHCCIDLRLAPTQAPSRTLMKVSRSHADFWRFL